MKEKKRIAIVSTYDELCGIASYTKALVDNLRNHRSEIIYEVFNLDQFLLKSKSKSARLAANKYIDKIAVTLSGYDHVNIQLEYGTFGVLDVDILRRLRKIVKSSRSLSVTFHTIFYDDDDKRKFKFNLTAKKSSIQRRFLNLLEKYEKKKKLTLIVHSFYDYRYFKERLGFGSVEHHPLAYLSPHEVSVINKSSSKNNFAQLKEIRNDAVIMGAFGFFSDYKGFEVAIKALRLLPSNYIFCIFGGLHPNSIIKRPPGLVDKYLSGIVDSLGAGQKVYELFDNLSLPESLSNLSSLFDRSPLDIHDRVLFMGSLSDSEFPIAMELCDICLFPYYEVGQSSSGPISIANELGVPIIASRTKAFMRFEKYHKGRVKFFDVGNHIQLAQIIRSIEKGNRTFYPKDYNVDSLCQLYEGVFVGA